MDLFIAVWLTKECSCFFIRWKTTEVFTYFSHKTTQTERNNEYNA